MQSEDARQLRFAFARLWGCDEDDFWVMCEGRVLGDNMELPPTDVTCRCACAG